jgi:hypothetical protein
MAVQQRASFEVGVGTNVSAGENQSRGLQMAFSVFLGLTIVTFIGVGVNTFLPWSPYKGIIAIAIATLVMGLTLVVDDRSPAISMGGP